MGGLIPEEIIDEIASRADIVDVVQKYVPLQRAGSRWKACCPFHKEKTPSFIVNPASNSCHCFGCGKGGNVFTFVMEMENLSFPEAVKLLARQYNVMIPEPERIVFRKGEKPSGEDYNIRERLFLLHEKLAAWYVANLRNNRNPAASAYFSTRKMSEESAKQFMVGASLDEWDGMMKWAEQEKFTFDELKLAHLVSESSKTPGKYFDFFRNRLMFPIWDEQGRISGFSARQIDPEQGGGKYVNSMESAVFKKSKILYGLNFARKSIGEKGFAVICEGQMDVIAMHASGVTNAVAPQGTAFGEDQARILKRCFYDRDMRITLATDADSAGVKAAIRDAEILLPMGAELKVASFPGGKDPDELLKNSGPEAVAEAVEKAVDFFQFLFDHFAAGKPLSSPAEKAEVAEKMLRYIRLMESELSKDSHIRWLAERLDLSLDAFRREMGRQNLLKQSSGPARKRIYEDNSSPGEKAPEKGKGSLPDSEKFPRLHQAFVQLLKVLLKSRKLTEKAASELPAEMMDQGPFAVAVETLIEAQMNGEWEQAPAQITKKLALLSLHSPELDGILASRGEEEEKKKAPPPPPPAEPPGATLRPEEEAEKRREALRNERAEAKLRELGLPGPEETQMSIQRNNERLRKRDIARKTVADCILVIKQHFLEKERRSLMESILKTPPGEARNELLRRSVQLSRELVKLNNPEASFPDLPASSPSSPLPEEKGQESSSSPLPEENTALQEAGEEKEEDSFEEYREKPPEDYPEEEPYMEENAEEEEVDLPDILQ